MVDRQRLCSKIWNLKRSRKSRLDFKSSEKTRIRKSSMEKLKNGLSQKRFISNESCKVILNCISKHVWKNWDGCRGFGLQILWFYKRSNFVKALKWNWKLLIWKAHFIWQNFNKLWWANSLRGDLFKLFYVDNFQRMFISMKLLLNSLKKCSFFFFGDNQSCLFIHTSERSHRSQFRHGIHLYMFRHLYIFQIKDFLDFTKNIFSKFDEIIPDNLVYLCTIYFECNCYFPW